MMPILVVEDDADMRMLMDIVLTAEGYQVVEAADGLEALARYHEQRPSLILLDMRMPNMDGKTFCEILRAECAPVPPIVVVTAAADPAVRAAEVDADAWISKPFAPCDLVAIVRRFVDVEAALRRTPHPPE